MEGESHGILLLRMIIIIFYFKIYLFESIKFYHLHVAYILFFISQVIFCDGMCILRDIIYTGCVSCTIALVFPRVTKWCTSSCRYLDQAASAYREFRASNWPLA